MSGAQPVDYIAVALMNAIHSRQGSKHSLTYSQLAAQFELHNDRAISNSQLELGVRRLDHIGALELVVDPYADTLVETSDNLLVAALQQLPAAVQRGWSNEDWIKSALQNEQLWGDLASGVELMDAVEAVPTADGFVTLQHNSEQATSLENAIVAADEAIRSDNGAEDGERSWIRIHLDAGLSLVRRGGAILRGALISLVLEPLKAALKAASGTEAQKLIEIAIAAIKELLGL